MGKIAVCAFAFANNPNALSSQLIRERAFRVARAYRTDVLTQPELLPKRSDGFEALYLPGREPAPTLRLARAMVRSAVERECDSITVVAAPPHQKRCARDFAIALREVGASISVEFDHAHDFLPTSSWFCADSGQLHTRYRGWWIVREFILRLLPEWLYKRVVS